MQYQTNRMSLSRDFSRKPDFWAKFGPKAHKFEPEIFFQPQDHQYLLDILPVYDNMQNQKNLMVLTRENGQDHSKMEFGDKNNLETAQYLKN